MSLLFKKTRRLVHCACSLASWRRNSDRLICYGKRRHTRCLASRWALCALLLTMLAPTTGCLTLTEQQKSLFDRLFPENPDDPFLDDKARDIDRRLSNSSSQMGL